MSTTGLLIVDFQNDYFSSYIGAKLALSETEAASAQGAKILAQFREKNLPIIHVRHEFTTSDAPFFLPNSEGAHIHPSVAPADDEIIVLKHQINSFRETELNDILQKAGITKLIIIGAMSHMCIDAAARAATDLGYECHVAHDACATLDLEFNNTLVPAQQVHYAFMAALSAGYCNVASTQEILGLVADC
ncbi:MAG: nicotinamidase-related amidase [Oceanospirillaceae bacterium]|jgi:nicotinamidase-related amidase